MCSVRIDPDFGCSEVIRRSADQRTLGGVSFPLPAQDPWTPSKGKLTPCFVHNAGCPTFDWPTIGTGPLKPTHRSSALRLVKGTPQVGWWLTVSPGLQTPLI